MSTDRELLELAARAAGFAVFEDGNFSSCGKYCVGPATKADGAIEAGHYIRWNPLTDDGDALRLAVKLRFHINIFSATEDEEFSTQGFVEIWADGDDPIHIEWVEGADYETATRRAIVRAAVAELGRKS